MSSEDKRTAYSIYLTPKADEILKGYVKGSGFLSISRTVEEMIIAFDSLYKMFETIKPDELLSRLGDSPGAAIIWTSVKVVLSRLQCVGEG